ncbi:MAG: hypothetical protein JWP12_393 [Bacteroidetes bacterium]|nr:hypothetical protein [Bacteroidota bacterium]
MKKTLSLVCVFISVYTIHAQTQHDFWSVISDAAVSPQAERTIIPDKYEVVALTSNNLKTTLFSAPNEKTMQLKNSTTIIELPFPDGTMEQFRVVESPMMAAELGTRFPEIKTFNVQSVSQPGVFGKLDWTDFGFHAMIRTPSGDFFIDPYCRTNVTDYITYNTADFHKTNKQTAPGTDVIESARYKEKHLLSSGIVKSEREATCAGDQLRTYRLAVACTGEYAQAATGLSAPTTAQILSAVVTTVNRVDGVYETEVAVKLVLIANETSLLFGNYTTDPFTGNDDGGILIGESQSVIDYYIPNADYDIGHTFSTGGGGLAYLGCVCITGEKASAITGSTYPVGDAYDIDYVAHEMGHQFGGDHTFAANTGGCNGNGNPGTQVEPGSGVTIMAYAGICDYNDLAAHSIAYFHTVNFDEIMDYTTYGDGSICPVVTLTSNQAPFVTGSATYTIPYGTPFILTGSATDPDGDALTYQWEENDNGPTADWNAGTAPYFRSYDPVASPSRMFPKLSVVLSGNYTSTIGEYLPSTPQTLYFRLTARDNKMGGGGVCYADSHVILANAGPLKITYPNTTGIIWASGSVQTITWDVNSTNLAPVNCANVNILISTDGGTTFTTLLANTPNDGTQLISAPVLAVTKTTCRIKVESVGNIFFDINDKNFTITAGTTGITEFASTALSMQVIPNPFNDEIQLSFSGISKSEKTNLVIYDLLGNVVLKDTFNGEEELTKKYNVSALSSGVYFVTLFNTQQKAVSKLVKE